MKKKSTKTKIGQAFPNDQPEPEQAKSQLEMDPPKAVIDPIESENVAYCYQLAMTEYCLRYLNGTDVIDAQEQHFTPQQQLQNFYINHKINDFLLSPEFSMPIPPSALAQGLTDITPTSAPISLTQAPSSAPTNPIPPPLPPSSLQLSPSPPPPPTSTTPRPPQNHRYTLFSLNPPPQIDFSTIPPSVDENIIKSLPDNNTVTYIDGVPFPEGLPASLYSLTAITILLASFEDLTARVALVLQRDLVKQKDLARVIGVSSSTLSPLLRGKYKHTNRLHIVKLKEWLFERERSFVTSVIAVCCICGINQRNLAELIGLDESSVAKWITMSLPIQHREAIDTLVLQHMFRLTSVVNSDIYGQDPNTLPLPRFDTISASHLNILSSLSTNPLDATNSQQLQNVTEALGLDNSLNYGVVTANSVSTNLLLDNGLASIPGLGSSGNHGKVDTVQAATTRQSSRLMGSRDGRDSNNSPTSQFTSANYIDESDESGNELVVAAAGGKSSGKRRTGAGKGGKSGTDSDKVEYTYHSRQTHTSGQSNHQTQHNQQINDNMSNNAATGSTATQISNINTMMESSHGNNPNYQIRHTRQFSQPNIPGQILINSSLQSQNDPSNNNLSSGVFQPQYNQNVLLSSNQLLMPQSTSNGPGLQHSGRLPLIGMDSTANMANQTNNNNTNFLHGIPAHLLSNLGPGTTTIGSTTLISNTNQSLNSQMNQLAQNQSTTQALQNNTILNLGMNSINGLTNSMNLNLTNNPLTQSKRSGTNNTQTQNPLFALTNTAPPLGTLNTSLTQLTTANITPSNNSSTSTTTPNSQGLTPHNTTLSTFNPPFNNAATIGNLPISSNQQQQQQQQRPSTQTQSGQIAQSQSASNQPNQSQLSQPPSKSTSVPTQPGQLVQNNSLFNQIQSFFTEYDPNSSVNPTFPFLNSAITNTGNHQTSSANNAATTNTNNSVTSLPLSLLQSGLQPTFASPTTTTTTTTTTTIAAPQSNTLNQIQQNQKLTPPTTHPAPQTTQLLQYQQQTINNAQNIAQTITSQTNLNPQALHIFSGNPQLPQNAQTAQSDTSSSSSNPNTLITVTTTNNNGNQNGNNNSNNNGLAAQLTNNQGEHILPAVSATLHNVNLRMKAILGNNAPNQTDSGTGGGSLSSSAQSLLDTQAASNTQGQNGQQFVPNSADPLFSSVLMQQGQGQRRSYTQMTTGDAENNFTSDTNHPLKRAPLPFNHPSHPLHQSTPLANLTSTVNPFNQSTNLGEPSINPAFLDSTAENK